MSQEKKKERVAYKFTMIPNDIIDNPKMRAVDFRIYCAIRWHGKSRYPSYERLAAMCGLSRKTVERSIQRMKREGYLLIEKKWKSNSYTLNVNRPSSVTRDAVVDNYQASLESLSSVTGVPYQASPETRKLDPLTRDHNKSLTKVDYGDLAARQNQGNGAIYDKDEIPF